MQTTPHQPLAVLEEYYFGPNKHEAAEIARLPELVEGVRCFVDVGASLGQYSYFAAKSLKDAKFYCVEADPFKVKRLRELTAKWQQETGNHFQVIEKAASDSKEILTFFVPGDHLSSGALFPLDEAVDGWKKIEVEALTLDAMFNGVDVDFIKLDVEGAEYRALVGAANLMRRCNLKLLLEIAPWGDKERSHKPSDVLRLLASYGYNFEIFENHYLFKKSGSFPARWLKSRAMGFILDRPELKHRVKNLFNKLRNR
jgi:FkbM family methyltransferase